LLRGLRPYGQRPTPGLCRDSIVSVALHDRGGIGCADCMPPPPLGARRRL